MIEKLEPKHVIYHFKFQDENLDVLDIGQDFSLEIIDILDLEENYPEYKGKHEKTLISIRLDLKDNIITTNLDRDAFFSKPEISDDILANFVIEFKRCADCGNSDFVLKCGGCNKVYYCGKECQERHRSIHKVWCKKIGKRMKQIVLSNEFQYLKNLIVE